MAGVYIALLRGVNVGGNAMIKMAELKTCLDIAGLHDVQTYIQSGNIIFSSEQTDTIKLAASIEKAIKQQFKLTVSVVVISDDKYRGVIKNVPKGWGEDPEWKYNLIFLLPPYDTKQIMRDIGQPKPDIETLTPGKGVIYQAISIKMFGRTTSGKLASNPVYKRMTIRNHRTGAKILELLKH